MMEAWDFSRLRRKIRARGATVFQPQKEAFALAGDDWNWLLQVELRLAVSFYHQIIYL